jgi:hypothetical protein
MTDLLTLPASHTDTELELARLIAELLGSDELHVFWSSNEGSRTLPRR